MAITILVLLGIAGFTCPVSAQLDRATLAGTVSDSSGAVVPGARVELQSPVTGLRREVQTGANGNYTFSLVPIGVYTLTITRTGFRTVAMKDLRLGVGDNRTQDIGMEVSSVESALTVESVLAPLDSTSAVVGTVIGAQQMREIPLNGRHWASLMALAPGAINTGEGNQQSIRFVGRARDDNNWTFDGLDATGVKDPRQEAALRLVISTDSIAEFRVNSTLYSAESGSGAGAQVNIVSKSGTNEFHGSVFEFVRNDVFDARNPFDTSKQPFRLNQFGGSTGGPILKNRTFFFTNYEGLRQRVSQTFRNDVPSAAFRARATTAAIRQIMDAYPLGNERTSNAEIDRVAGNASQAWREDAGMLRVDHRFNDKNTFFARYNIDDGTINAPRTVIAGDRQESFFRPSNFVLQYQRIFSPSVVNETKAGFNRSALNRFNYSPFNESIAVTGFTTLNNSNRSVETGTSYSLIDNLVVTRGRHTLKMGSEVRRAHVNVADPLGDSVTVTFATRADLLVNRVDRVAIGGGSPVLGTRKWYYYAYVQDDFKVNSELTLNLGLRYEYYGVNREVAGRYRVFDLFACRGFCPQGTPWYFPDRNNFDPRVGLAWAPKALNGKTVIRSGAGIYHGPGQIDDQNAALDNMANNFSLTSAEAPGLSFPVAPFLALARTVGITPRSLQRDRRDLYSAQWGLSIQQQLPAAFITQIGYVGSAASKVTTRKYINNLDPATKLRPLPTFGRIDEKNNDGKSNFNALQLSLHRRAARGVTWGTEYMWSHSINDNSIGGGEGSQPQNATCRACDRGNSPQDIRHTITSNWIYQLPFGPGKAFLSSGLASKALGGWETSGIWTARTGRMLTVSVTRSTADVPDGNTSGQRPDLVPGVSVYPSGGPTLAQWLNPAAFAIPARGTWGNAGRVVATGPGLVQVDVALQKNTRLTESKALVFRIEAFNLFNRTQAGNPGTNFTSPASFGIVTAGLNRTIGTGTSRQLQLALRLNF
ncbi:MAG TPA: TonB-dependent receptor [Bryobacteraceae bacterium]|nr:TonB-dependent receptor [Bryobacteraceae bacterium]